MELQDGEQLLALMRGFQIPCVLAAGADLDVFNLLAGQPLTAAEAAERLSGDPRAVTILLDALVGIGMVLKQEARYTLAPAVAPLLVDNSPPSVAAMLRHQANCLRRWAQLPWVVQTGQPADIGTSVRGAEADQESFIGAMHVVSRAVAGPLVREINPGGFRCVLDIGGGPGTWTLAWLQAEPGARAILFDLPEVVSLARARLSKDGLAERVELVAGDYHADPLPTGADLVWLSAIVHQNSPEENRALYGRIAQALDPGGRLLIRDVVMDSTRTQPLAGALFAVNMLVGTRGGNTYTLDEIRNDLLAAGFDKVQLLREDEAMNSIVSAHRGG